VSVAVQSKLTVTTLRIQFDGHAEFVLPLTGFLEELPRENKYTVRSYRVLRPLPSAAEYKTIRDALYEQPFERAIREAVTVVESVRVEVQGWLDALPPQIRSTEKGNAIRNCINLLQRAVAPPSPSGLEKLNIRVVFLPNHYARTK